MEPRIDPPSSLHRLTVEDIETFAVAQMLLVIEDHDRPVACAFLTHRADKIYIGKLAVSPAFRGHGFAKRLIDHAANLAAEAGLHLLELETRIELTENHAAFARLGFVKTAETSHAGYNRPTSITMQKRL